MRTITTILAIMTLYSVEAFAQWSPGEPFTDPRDGRTYQTVVIGTQVWMAENMNIGNHISSNRPGARMSDNGIIEKYCWKNAIDNCNGTDGALKRGGMYEWQEAVQYWNGQPTLPVQGICPEGWHVASNGEWRTLTLRLGGSAAYTALLEGGSSGFDALLTGYRSDVLGDFRPALLSEHFHAYFWTADQRSTDNAHLIEVGENSMRAIAWNKEMGLCVRCVMDETATGIHETGIPINIELHDAVVRPGRRVLMHFSASAGYVNIIITDLLGRIVHRSKAYALHGENYHQVDLASYAAGPYVLYLHTASGSAAKLLRIL